MKKKFSVKKELAESINEAKKETSVNHLSGTQDDYRKESERLEDIARTKRIRTFEDACAELGLRPEKIKSPLGKRGVAFTKLAIIIRALNGRKHYKLLDGNVEHWHPVFYRRKNGTTIIFKESSFIDDDLITGCNTPLHTLKSKELSDYCAKQFFYLWQQYIL